jgi:tripartite-type tricarboxylate transporter receptor subunit TctC
MRRREFITGLGSATAWPVVSIVSSASLTAQTYPSRPITVVVTFPAGGPSDTVMRIVVESMRGFLGQSVIIENVAGAAGSLGTARVARAAADGYTVGLGDWGTHVVNGANYSLSYDVVKDFEPVALMTTNPALIIAKKTMPANDLVGLIAWLKSNPDKATAGTNGQGGSTHIYCAFFQTVTGTRFQLVPYRGLGPVMQDLVSGQIDIAFGGVADSLPQIRAGLIKVYAVTAKNRLAAAPDIPTVDEAGMPEFYLALWRAIFAPKGTPAGIIAKLNAAVTGALADPAVRTRLADLGVEIAPRDQQTPEALRAFQKEEIEKWWPIIKAANIKAQ